jgi:PGF-CTERM protein
MRNDNNNYTYKLRSIGLAAIIAFSVLIMAVPAGAAAGSGLSSGYTSGTSGDHGVALTATDDGDATDTVQKVVMTASTAIFEVSDLQAPASAVQGETITVNATVTNVGNETGSTTAEFVFASDVLLNQTVTLGGGNATGVSFRVPTGAVSPGTYEHGVAAGESVLTANITIQQPATFGVSNLQAPATAVQGETIEVSGTVENTGDVSGTAIVEISFNGSVMSTQQLTLGSGESVSTSANVSTAGFDAGSYTYSISIGDAVQTSEVTLEEGQDDTADGDEGETITPGQPGFGLGIALIALLTVVLFARRRV